MANYARQLLDDRTKTDCEKLALLAYKAGQVTLNNSSLVTVEVMLGTLTEYQWFYPNRRDEQPLSDPSFQVGIHPPTLNGFGDTGFKQEFQDGSNQVRHFVGSFAAGYIFGVSTANVLTWIQEHTMSLSNKDVALGELAVGFGAAFDVGAGGNTVQLAQQIWSYACGQTTPLRIP
jgi:hypothetical protein